MSRLMKLIIRYDKSRDKEGFEEILEPWKLSKSALMKIVVASSSPREQRTADGGSLEESKNPTPRKQPEVPGFPFEAPEDDVPKKKKKKHKSKNSKIPEVSRRDG